MTLARSSLILLCASITASPAAAALSGYYDSAEQIGAIMSAPDVADALRQAPITDISRSGTRKDGAIEWEISSDDCELKVYLTATPPQGIGKTTYEVSEISACQ